jgi:hypothetical protein
MDGPLPGGPSEQARDEEIVDARPGGPPRGSVTDPTEPSNTSEPDLEVHSLANLGDSISQGFDADDSVPIHVNAITDGHAETIFHDNPALSWVQGSDPRVGSIAEHYRARDPNMVLTPLSRSGSELVRDLEKQAREIAKRKVAPDLVYVLLGGNDICNRERAVDPTTTMYSVGKWREAVVKGLTALTEVLPAGATARFVSMPRVDILYEQLGDATVPVTYDSPVGQVHGSSTCKALWTLTAQNGRPGICALVTLESSAEKRKLIGQRIDAYNDALAEEVRRFDTDATLNPKRIAFQSDWHGSLDAGGAKNASGGTFVYEPNHVSKLDCFHPSVAGQHELSELVLTRAKWKP